MRRMKTNNANSIGLSLARLFALRSATQSRAVPPRFRLPKVVGRFLSKATTRKQKTIRLIRSYLPAGRQVRLIRVLLIFQRGHWARPPLLPSRPGIRGANMGVPSKRISPSPSRAGRNIFSRFEYTPAFLRPSLRAQKPELRCRRRGNESSQRHFFNFAMSPTH